MAGKHRARNIARRNSGAYALLGTGALTLGLGVALTTGSGVAAADATNSEVSGSGVSPSSGQQPGTSTIRTTVSAQSVNTSTRSSVPVEESGTPTEEQTTSVVTNRDSVVRQLDPAATGDNDNDNPTLAETLIAGGSDGEGLTAGIPGFNSAPDIPFIELGGGGGGLLATIAGALGF